MKFISKLLKNKSLNYSILDQILVSGSNFISTLIIARLLGLNDFGIFATLWLILLMINSLHASLIVLPMMSLIPKQTKILEYFGSLLFIQILFVCLSSFISFFIAMIYFNLLNISLDISTLFLFTIMVAFYHAQDFYRRYFFALKKFDKVLIIDFLSYFLRIITLIYFLFFLEKISINNIFTVFIITYALGILISIFNYKSIFDKKYLKQDVLQHWSISKWLLPSGFMQWTSINLFIIVASFILGPIVVGAIRIGQNIVLAFNVILQGIENFIPLDASQIYKNKGRKALNIFLKKVTKFGLFVALIFGLSISFFSKEIITLLYGENYSEYNSVIIWYSIILIFMFILVITRILLRTIGQTKIWYKAYLFSSIYSTIVVYPLISIFLLNGVMFGILSAHIVLLGSTYLMLKSEEKNVLN